MLGGYEKSVYRFPMSNGPVFKKFSSVVLIVRGMFMLDWSSDRPVFFVKVCSWLFGKFLWM